MSAKALTVVLYHYDASPFATKVKNMLTLKRIPHKRVSTTMFRPELSELLGVTYRRIPVLAIGNDVYCDTSLIASALERRFPVSEGYGTLFPPRVGSDKADTGMTLALMMYWSDRVVFPLAASSLPYGKFDAAFIKDREAWEGKRIDVKGLAAYQPVRTSAIAAHLNLLEQQLSDGREWLMDTSKPGLADIATHFVFSWVKYFRNIREVYDIKLVPKSIAWITRVSEHFDKLQKDGASPFENIEGSEAARLVCSTQDQPPLPQSEPSELSRLSLKLGEPVSVSPSDNGKVPTVGRLLALNHEEIVVETLGKAGRVRCHFPRLNFSISGATSQTSAKL